MRRRRVLCALVSAISLAPAAPLGHASAPPTATGAGRLAFISTGAAHLDVLDVATGRITYPVRAEEWHVLSGLSWSPDAKRIAYGDTIGVAEPILGELRVVDVATRRIRTVVSLPTLFVSGVAWSPRGDRIAFTTTSAWTPVWGLAVAQTSVHVVDADGSDHRVLGDGHSPAWAPDGRRLAFVGPAGVTIVDLDTLGTPTTVDAPLRSTFAPAWSPDGRWVAFLHAKTGIVTNAPEVSIAEARTGRVRALDVRSWDAPSWAPDSTRLTLNSLDAGGLGVVDIRTRRVRILVPAEEDPWSASWGPGELIAFDDAGMIRFVDATTGARRPGAHGSPGSALVWAPRP